MKVIKTLFRTEIEITPEELNEFMYKFQFEFGVWSWICELLGIKYQD